MSGHDPHDRIDEKALLEHGQRRVRWTGQHMRLLGRLREQFRQSQPFAGLTIGMCLHVEPKTAVLCGVLQAGGANVVITGSPGTTKDDTVAVLRHSGITVYGQQSDTTTIHQDNIRQVLAHQPDLFLDNGADLVATYLAHPAWRVIAGTAADAATRSRRVPAPGPWRVP